jgi:DNA-binding transcriptional MerR regulator
MAEDSTRGQGTERDGKSEAAFRTISEVAKELDLPQHVLRFWETRFTQLKPLKRGGGRRYYRTEDMQLLRRIRDLLYMDGYTIKGVQKLLRESGSVRAFVENSTPSEASTQPTSHAVTPPGRTTEAPNDEAQEMVTADSVLRPAIESALAELRTLRDELRRSAET